MAERVCEDCGREFDNVKSYAGHRTGCGNLPWDDPELLERLYHEEKLSTFQIAERWEDVEQPGIWWMLEKHGIETRSSAEGIRTRYASNLTKAISSGRIWFQFVEYGEERTFLLSQLVALLDNAADDVFDDSTHVHHKNSHPIDDRSENLEVLPIEEHLSHHGKETVDAIARDEHGNFVKE
ncbi:hypothetical protein [Natrinema halophilum]|uniref:hypothetical protein n=1 Tax=Natrinema halophilum TaxID=1699371 RepID=UPI001F4065A3|nr:hypothetical protein [Natrinema halophilum]UHQ96477.1 hypothetical protein HYG82_23430 [Natrinema halophilum]